MVLSIHVLLFVLFHGRIGNLGSIRRTSFIRIALRFSTKINDALQRWMLAYNRHPLETEHNSTPTQLWIESMLRLQNSGRTASESIFDEENQNDFGIDWDGPCPVEGDNNIEVPRIAIEFPSHVLVRLQSTIDRNGPSEVLGMDIYLSCLNLLLSNSERASHH